MSASRMSRAVAGAEGLRADDAALACELVEVWRRHRARNKLRTDYYLGHRKARDLCISVPPHLRNLRQVVSWPAKAVDSLADRSVFDAFICDDDARAAALRRMADANGMARAYRRAVISELKHGTAFATVAAGGEGMPAVVRFYPATAAAALWDFPRDRILAGMVIVDTSRQAGRRGDPTWVNLYTDEAVVRIREQGGRWSAEYEPHSMGRPLMEPLCYQATLERPFGRSRITRAVMDITDDAQRACRRAEIAAEFAASTQKYLLGAPDDVFDEKSRWDAALDAIVTFSKDADGDAPSFGQLAQPSMQPHTEYYRSLAARFSSETSIPLSCLGVNTDANPQSADAARVEAEPLVIEAQNVNADNGRALRNIAYMALAAANDTGFDAEASAPDPVSVHFKDPSMPSLSAVSDAIVKQVQAFPWMAESDVPLERLGYTDEEIQRLANARERAASADVIGMMLGGDGDAAQA